MRYLYKIMRLSAVIYTSAIIYISQSEECGHISVVTMCSKWDTDSVVQRFREYLQIPSVHPDVDYDECITFLTKQAQELGLPIRVYELVPKKPVAVITWAGTEPALPAILLNSHMDVVPVYEEYWTYPPFEARISDEGFIYARGTQDMKGIGMMHLESVRRLKFNGVRLRRTVHMSFVPDEEIGSVDGMKTFSESEEFKELNIGFGLDESIPSAQINRILVFNGEKITRSIKITSTGEPGHGSSLPSNTAGEKLHKVIGNLLQLRSEQKSKFDSGVPLGDVISINLTKLEGGVQTNVLPERLSASFDIRLPPHINFDRFDNMIDTWCKEAGEGVEWEVEVNNPQIKSTSIDGSVVFWTVLVKAMDEMNIDVDCMICPGATDARFLRKQGIPSINFSPMLNTPVLLHGHDERIHVDAYKKGIDIMEKVVKAVANV